MCTCQTSTVVSCDMKCLVRISMCVCVCVFCVEFLCVCGPWATGHGWPGCRAGGRGQATMTTSDVVVSDY